MACLIILVALWSGRMCDHVVIRSSHQIFLPIVPRTLLLMTVINYWTNLSKYCDLSMVRISILLEMPKAGANDWSEQQWKSRSRRWVYSCQETGLPFPPFSVFSKNFHWTDPCSIYVASELSGNVLKMVKKTWDGQYYSKAICAAKQFSLSLLHMFVGTYLQVTQWYLDQSRIWKKTNWMIMENIRC